jgi:hypothetical protein
MDREEILRRVNVLLKLAREFTAADIAATRDPSPENRETARKAVDDYAVAYFEFTDHLMGSN